MITRRTVMTRLYVTDDVAALLVLIVFCPCAGCAVVAGARVVSGTGFDVGDVIRMVSDALAASDLHSAALHNHVS